MNNSAQSTADIVVRMEQDHIKFIDLQFTDVVGMVKNVTIPIHELKAALENGVWFDGSSIDGFARVAESDMHLRPDPSTFAIIPWLTGEEATARLICDVYTPDGQPFPGIHVRSCGGSLMMPLRWVSDIIPGPSLNFSFLNQMRMEA